ncbi:MAG: class I SAM-dependent methyltransferase [Pirellulales bacterium]|nr:class I SAM-dependent methyltransferase [Pirellulales bacterium]
MSKSEFNDLTDFYEAMIDWPKRLANEEPFYRHWFEKIGAGRIIDVACGTGRHAAMFHDWGLQVEGADLSPAMIARARANFGEDERLRWVVRGFEQPIQFDGENKKSFDAALCVGNSLALAPNVETVRRAIRQMFAAVRPGGIVVVHVLNLWLLPDGPCIWQKCKKIKSFSPEPTATALAGNSAIRENLLADKTPAVAVGSGLNEDTKNENAENDVLILKGVHRSGSRGYVEFLAASLADGKLLHQESVPFLGLESPQLEQYARDAGAKAIHFFGDYMQQPYEREKSVDLMMVAEKISSSDAS